MIDLSCMLVRRKRSKQARERERRGEQRSINESTEGKSGEEAEREKKKKKEKKRKRSSITDTLLCRRHDESIMSHIIGAKAILSAVFSYLFVLLTVGFFRVGEILIRA